MPVMSCKNQGNCTLDRGQFKDTCMNVTNGIVDLKLSSFGGAIVSFTFRDKPVNPLSWKLTRNEMPENNRKGAPHQGHFLCIACAGPGYMAPVELPSYGEASNIWWLTDAGTTNISMVANAPLEKYSVKRVISLVKDAPAFLTEETFTNCQENNIWISVLQHATTGTPFLDSTSIISCNATDGYNEELPLNPQFKFHWPTGYSDSLKTKLDITKTDCPKGFVTTQIIEDSIGWAVTASPSKGLLIGYVWKTGDYPYLHIWHGVKNGKIWSKGMEFSSNGFGDVNRFQKHTYHILPVKLRDKYLKKGDSMTKKYICFLLKIPSNYQKMEKIEIETGRIVMSYNVGGIVETQQLRLENSL